jgi:hypothetical protein
MSAEISSDCQAEEAQQPGGTAAEDRASLGTLTWRRAARVAALAGAVAGLTALGIAAGHMVKVVGPPAPAHTASVVTQRAPAP